MDVTVEDDEIEVTDPTKTTLTLNVSGWEPVADGPELDRPTDAEISGVTNRIEFPARFCVVHDEEANETTNLGSRNDQLSLDEGSYIVRVTAEVKSYVSFKTDAFVSSRNDTISLEFESDSKVTFGFKSHTAEPSDLIEIPRTPEGVATALTYSSVSIRTGTADRSFPSMRNHPPKVEFGPQSDVPESVRRRRHESGVRIEVPAEYRYLYPIASLSHYLSARVELGTRTPAIVADGRRYELGSMPSFEQNVNEVLRRVFFLDCLARSAGPYGVGFPFLPTLEDIDLSREEMYDAPIAERLWAYIDAPFDTIVDEFPKWHLCMYVEPSVEYATVLPYMVNDLAAIYRPLTEDLPSDERLSRSLDDFYRGTERRVSDQSPRSIEDAPTVELSKPKLEDGDIHGWLGEGTPIDVFKATPEAYENREKYRDRSEEKISVVAVLNDEEMSEEHAEVADIYRERTKDLSLDISIRENVRTNELASTLESGYDLLHFIGHCEESGLRCPDGTLAVSDITESNVQTFFLNACGSYYEGLSLVKKGSVAGAITFKTVLDEQAALVGTMFARLAAHGYSIERALELASRRVMMNKDYAVVGDGTHVLSQSTNIVGAESRLQKSGPDEYVLDYTVRAAWMPGAGFRVSHETAEQTIFGDTLRTEWDRDGIVDFLETAHCSVIYDGDLHWSEELANKLRNE